MSELTPEQIEAIANARKRSAQALATELALLNEESEVYQSISQQVETNNKLQRVEAEMAQRKISFLKEQLQEKIKLGKADEAALKSIGEQIKEQERLLKGANERIEASETLQATTSRIVTTLTGIDDSWKTTFVGSFVHAASSAEDLSQAVGALGAGLQKTISGNVVGSFASKVAESTLYVAYAQDEALAAFNKTTGAIGRYNSQITEIADTNRRFGVTAQDSAEAFALLYTNLNLFSFMAPNAQKSMTELVAQLDAVGVSSEVAVTNIELAMRALGMNAKEAGSLQLELLSTAEALKMSPQSLAEGFAKVVPQLAAHGKNTIRVFKQMSRQSKETGLAFEELMSFASQMNTYEGAAQIAADFNHLLGGSFLNSLELLNATEPERIKLVQESFKATGRVYDQMDEHTKRAIAHHLGLKDVASASRLLNEDMIGLTAGQRAQRIEQEKLAERAKITQSMFNQMKNAAMSLAVSMKPLIDLTVGFFNAIAKLNDKTRDWFGGVTGIVPILVGLAGITKIFGLHLKIAGIFQALFTGFTTADTGAKIANSAALRQQMMAQKMSNLQMMAGLKTMVAFAGAVLLIGAGIGAAAAGIGYMAQNFAKLNNDQMIGVVGTLGVLGASIITLGALMLSPIGQGVALGMLALGGGIMLMGGGLALIAGNVASIVTSINALSLIKAKAFAEVVSNLAVQSPQIETATGVMAVRAAAVQRSQASVQTPVGMNQKSSQQPAQVVPVQIILDGRVLGEIVDKRADKRIGEALKSVGGRRNLTPLKSSVALG